MDGVVFPLKFSSTVRISRRFWGGFLIKNNRLFALILPVISKKKAEQQITNIAKEKIIYCPKKYSKQIRCLQQYFLKGILRWQPKLDLSGYSDFAQKVLKLVHKIPKGKVYNYAWIAKKVNSPLAMRAVGSVLANNRIPLIIPCHRIIKKNGLIGQFSGGFGKKLKKIMLKIENTQI
ncbi:methylated-DNA--[protein]-cysteine S-methyltransferase [Candidatus Margulisiibacteriota bacterium]